MRDWAIIISTTICIVDYGNIIFEKADIMRECTCRTRRFLSFIFIS